VVIVRSALARVHAGAGAWLLAASAALAQPAEFTPEGDFSESAVRRGVVATREQCAAVDGAVWADAGSHGQACIRYWAAGFPGKPVARAIVFLHGDVWVGAGKTSAAYLNNSVSRIQRDAESWSRRIAAPYVFVGRPGTHGSSGDHMQRRRVAESRILSTALDRVKEHLAIGEWVVAGQSGGGHVTAALLTQRSDIVCAVPTSAPSSPRVRWSLRGLKRDTTGFADSYEPTEHLGGARMHPRLRVFVLGDPQDRNVVWPSQSILADRLKETGVAVETLAGEGTGPDRHGLSASARIVAGWCHQDLQTPEILRRAAEGLRG